MKKFYTKLSRPNWRVTVPNLNTSFFGKAEEKTDAEEKSGNLRNSGSYDLQNAEQQYENEIKTEESDSEADSKYEDASPMYEKKNDFENDSLNNVEDLNIYADVDNIQNTEVPDPNSYEYDIPRISFSFFEESLRSESETDTKPATSSPKRKSEIRITLAQPTIEEEDEEREDSVETNEEMSKSDDDISILAIRCEIDEPKTIEMSILESLDRISIGKLSKCDSEPHIERIEEQEDEDNFYKVPKSYKRLSQSLKDFNTLEIKTPDLPVTPDLPYDLPQKPSEIVTDEKITKQANYIVHNVDLKSEETQTNGSIEETRSSFEETQSSFEYCDARSKLPAKVRRATLLRRPHVRSRAQDTWFTLRAKVNNIITTHSAAQRVGANTAGEKILNLEEFCKNSRTRCRKIVQNTSKIFHKKKGQENVDPSSDSSSQIVKNDAFFAKVDLNEGSEVGTSVDSEVLSNDRFGSRVLEERGMSEFDFGTLKSAFRRSRIVQEGQNGFDDLRRFVKQGGDFCKELSAILQERSEAELQYAKSLSKLSSKLSRACREGVGGLNEAWKCVANDMESRSEIHRQFSSSLTDDIVKPLKVLTDYQHKTRKLAEGAVDKTARSLSDWRAAEAKSKKQSHVCARDNEKLQDALLDVRLSRSTSLIQLAHMHNHKALSDKESAKLEGKKRKAEDAVKKADIEYYTLCVRAERARLEWESAVVRGSNTFQNLEEERLKNLKSVLSSYLQHNNDICPKIMESTEKLKKPVEEAEAHKDMSAFINLRNSSQHVSEQLLPDFYCEHITLAMNRERRKQALIKLLHLIRQDLERERKSKNGLENLSRAIKQTPNFGSEDSQQNVSEKLYHMRSMLTYLEGARYKVQSALAELESKQRTSHPLAAHITITRDKSGLQQSILKVPQWLKEEFVAENDSPLEKTSLVKSEVGENDLEWTDDRGMADGNSNQHDSDFDEFSSQGSSVAEECNNIPLGQCKALYVYTANLPDELNLNPGDVLSVYRKQEDGWWLGECNGCVGIFPATYVENI